MKYVKYAIINIIAIVAFFGIWGFLYNYNGDDLVSFVLEKVFYIFPFAYYAIVAVIDTNKNNQISKFGLYTRNFYLIMAGVVLIVGVITSIYWCFTGKTGSASLVWISWKYNYIVNFLFYLLYSIFTFIAGILVNMYIWVISYVYLKIKKYKTQE